MAVVMVAAVAVRPFWRYAATPAEPAALIES